MKVTPSSVYLELAHTFGDDPVLIFGTVAYEIYHKGTVSSLSIMLNTDQLSKLRILLMNFLQEEGDGGLIRQLYDTLGEQPEGER